MRASNSYPHFHFWVTYPFSPFPSCPTLRQTHGMHKDQVETPLGNHFSHLQHSRIQLCRLTYVALPSPRALCIYDALLFTSSLTHPKDGFEAAAHHSRENGNAGQDGCGFSERVTSKTFSFAFRIRAPPLPKVQFTLKRKLSVIKETTPHHLGLGPGVTSVSNNVFILGCQS